MVVLLFSLAAIMCYSDAACNNLIGTQKETLEECCDSFDDGGIEGLFYTVGSQCFTCAAIGGIYMYM